MISDEDLFLWDQEVTDALEMAFRTFQDQGDVETDGDDETDAENECNDDDDAHIDPEDDDWSKILCLLNNQWLFRLSSTNFTKRNNNNNNNNGDNQSSGKNDSSTTTILHITLIIAFASHLVDTIWLA